MDAVIRSSERRRLDREKNLKFSSSLHCKVKRSEEIDGPGNRPVLFAGRKSQYAAKRQTVLAGE